MDGFRVVKLSEVIRQMDVVITCTGTLPALPHAAKPITSAVIITKFQHLNRLLGYFIFVDEIKHFNFKSHNP